MRWICAATATAPGLRERLYSVAEHVLDLSALADIVRGFPVTIIGHSLGGAVTLLYAGVYPDRVKKVIAIEGVGPAAGAQIGGTACGGPHPGLDRADSRRGESHAAQLSRPGLGGRADEGGEPVLSDAVAEHLTLHGTNWNADGSIIWKFDNFARLPRPYGMNMSEAAAVFSRMLPGAVFWGLHSFAVRTDLAPEASAIADRRS